MFFTSSFVSGKHGQAEVFVPRLDSVTDGFIDATMRSNTVEITLTRTNGDELGETVRAVNIYSRVAKQLIAFAQNASSEDEIPADCSTFAFACVYNTPMRCIEGISRGRSPYYLQYDVLPIACATRQDEIYQNFISNLEPDQILLTGPPLKLCNGDPAPADLIQARQLYSGGLHHFAIRASASRSLLLASKFDLDGPAALHTREEMLRVYPSETMMILPGSSLVEIPRLSNLGVFLIG
jgi:hypothetical protein